MKCNDCGEEAMVMGAGCQHCGEKNEYSDYRRIYDGDRWVCLCAGCQLLAIALLRVHFPSSKLKEARCEADEAAKSPA